MRWLPFLAVICCIGEALTEAIYCSGDVQTPCSSGFCYDSINLSDGRITAGCASSPECIATGCKLTKDKFSCCCSGSTCNGKSAGLLRSRLRQYQERKPAAQILKSDKSGRLTPRDVEPVHPEPSQPDPVQPVEQVEKIVDTVKEKDEPQPAVPAEPKSADNEKKVVEVKVVEEPIREEKMEDPKPEAKIEDKNEESATVQKKADDPVNDEKHQADVKHVAQEKPLHQMSPVLAKEAPERLLTPEKSTNVKEDHKEKSPDNAEQVVPTAAEHAPEHPVAPQVPEEVSSIHGAPNLAPIVQHIEEKVQELKKALAPMEEKEPLIEIEEKEPEAILKPFVGLAALVPTQEKATAKPSEAVTDQYVSPAAHNQEPVVPAVAESAEKKVEGIQNPEPVTKKSEEATTEQPKSVSINKMSDTTIPQSEETVEVIEPHTDSISTNVAKEVEDIKSETEVELNTSFPEADVTPTIADEGSENDHSAVESGISAPPKIQTSEAPAMEAEMDNSAEAVASHVLDVTTVVDEVVAPASEEEEATTEKEKELPPAYPNDMDDDSAEVDADSEEDEAEAAEQVAGAQTDFGPDGNPVQNESVEGSEAVAASEHSVQGHPKDLQKGRKLSNKDSVEEDSGEPLPPSVRNNTSPNVVEESSVSPWWIMAALAVVGLAGVIYLFSKKAKKNVRAPREQQERGALVDPLLVENQQKVANDSPSVA